MFVNFVYIIIFNFYLFTHVKRIWSLFQYVICAIYKFQLLLLQHETNIPF